VRTTLHLAEETGGPGLLAAEAPAAAAAFLQALGVSLQAEGRGGTPARMARSYAELFTRRPFVPTTFPNGADDGYVELVVARPQTQERLTTQVADWIDEHLTPRAVGVVFRAEHTCMTLRGVQATGSTTMTSALLGSLRGDPAARQEFLTLAGAMP
jgi:GTP cyclohydrolase I